MVATCVCVHGGRVGVIYMCVCVCLCEESMHVQAAYLLEVLPFVGIDHIAEAAMPCRCLHGRARV